jgi:competence protein ComEC
MVARVPLAFVALAFAGGIALAPWIPESAAWTGLVVAVVWGASLVALGRAAPATACVLVGVAAAGVIRAIPPPPAAGDIAHLVLPATARIEGRLAADPARFAPDRARLLVDVERVDDQSRHGRVQLTVHGALAPVAEGARVATEARLHAAGGFRNPGVFDYRAWLHRQGIHVVGSAAADTVVVVDDRTPWPVQVRHAMREAIARALPPTSAALLQGLLLGDRAGLPRDVDDGFRRAGVYHVLAVSGFNVALVAGAAFALLAVLGCGGRPAATGAIAVVIAFALVAGPEPSVLRAVVMGVLVLMATLLDRESSALNAIALAAVAILAVRPGDLADPGFQLSFAATLGIVLAPLPGGWVAGAAGISMAAQLAVLPIALWHFNQLSVVGVLANLGVVPLAGVATVLGLLGAALSAASEAAGAAVFHATWPVLLAMRGLVAVAAGIPGALLHLPAPHWTAVCAYVGALGAALLAWRWRAVHAAGATRLAVAAAAMLALAVAIGAWPLLRPPDGRLRITVLDVGQGEAIVVETPDGRTILVDAGPGGPLRLDTGERVVAPFLWNRGILRLAAVVATHDDQDHAGGVPAVLRRFPAGAVWAAATLPPRRHWFGGIPVVAMTARHRDEPAIVLRIDHGLASFLLTSDTDAAGEMDLMAAGAPLVSTVLKVAHHGSAGSTTSAFLAHVRPRLALISVGARNAYRHPAPSAMARLAAAGLRVHRTDLHGALVLETDGASLTVTRWATGEVESWCLDPETRCAGA